MACKYYVYRNPLRISGVHNGWMDEIAYPWLSPSGWFYSLKHYRNPGVTSQLIAPLLVPLSGCRSEIFFKYLDLIYYTYGRMCYMNSADWVFLYLVCVCVSVSTEPVTLRGGPTLERRMELITILSVRKIFRTWFTWCVSLLSSVFVNHRPLERLHESKIHVSWLFWVLHSKYSNALSVINHKKTEVLITS